MKQLPLSDEQEDLFTVQGPELKSWFDSESLLRLKSSSRNEGYKWNDVFSFWTWTQSKVHLHYHGLSPDVGSHCCGQSHGLNSCSTVTWVWVCQCSCCLVHGYLPPTFCTEPFLSLVPPRHGVHHLNLPSICLFLCFPAAADIKPPGLARNNLGILRRGSITFPSHRGQWRLGSTDDRVRVFSCQILLCPDYQSPLDTV